MYSINNSAPKFILLVFKTYIFISFLGSSCFAQPFNTKQERGEFLSKCYAVYKFIYDKDPTASVSQRKTLQSIIDGAQTDATRFISRSDFDNIQKTEYIMLERRMNRKYTSDRFDFCADNYFNLYPK